MMWYGNGPGAMGGWQGNWPSPYGQQGNTPFMGPGMFNPAWGGWFGYGPGSYGQSQMPQWQGYGTFPSGGAGFGPGFGGAPMNDQDLRYVVENALDSDPSVPAGAVITVDVQEGVVTLTGTVPNKRIKHAAGDDAWYIPQVTDVHNEINVAPRRERENRATGTASESITGGRRNPSSTTRQQG